MSVVISGFDTDHTQPFIREDLFYTLWKHILEIESLKLQTLDALKQIMLCQLDLSIFLDREKGFAPYDALPTTLVRWSEVDNVSELDIDNLDVKSLPHILVDNGDLKDSLGAGLYTEFQSQFSRIAGIRDTLAKLFKHWLQDPCSESSPGYALYQLPDSTMKDSATATWHQESLKDLLQKYSTQFPSTDGPSHPDMRDLTDLDSRRDTIGYLVANTPSSQPITMGFSKDKDAPPPYTEHLTRTSSHTPAPAYSSNTSSPLAPPAINNETLLPNSFKVGCREVVPFITVPEMILHLRLLAAFDRLQHVVRTTSETAGDVLDSDTRWSVFCTRAEKNFERWVEELGSTSAAQLDASNTWPALDVVMVWHSYVLNPRKFYEDTQRDMRVGKLGEIGFPLDKLTRFIDPVTLEYNPPRREKQSSASASLPFPTDPETSTFQLACPQCSTIDHVPWLKSQGMHTGYCQKDFKHLCVGKGCGLIIKHETLRVFKVCQDLTAIVNGRRHFLPGLGLMPTTGELTSGHAEVVSWAIVQVFKLAYDQATIKPLTNNKGEKYGVNSKKEQQLIMQQLEQQPPFTASNFGKHVLEWKLEKFEKILDDNLKSGIIARLSLTVPFRRIAIRLRISRMYAAYDHCGLASLALGPAVMRQANFIGKMKGMGWLEPGRFEGDGPGGPFLLQKAAARYHAFLDLMTTMPSGFLCPSE
ncbi:hypothetical protein QFC22_005114 [Naganishia vaughanmartiniae]|uniref:Uncharacterized protein n=1 Tax=Naganishia vaughanmartiniae TaxID=1424756 RepID=A0ACC2WX42_9TREE|nr:hypothetical protein QFC22_005114 [Naganishia vaughanmartiniae]